MRESGVLLHISSLPSRCGIGALGSEAREFVDFLAAAGQSRWQVLPVGPTGCGDSPYQTFSAFAGNPYFIDLDELRAAGLLKLSEYAGLGWGSEPSRADYGRLHSLRREVLEKAFARFVPDEKYAAFCLSERNWLDDYALFMALKSENGGAPWTEWDEAYRRRDPKALRAFSASSRKELDFWKFVQYEFSSQWTALHGYAASRGIKLIGDLPIYVAADSADVWARPELFELKSDLTPSRVAGCPPDYFSATGQLWGNPIYAWDAHRAEHFRWWTSRVKRSFELFDTLRIDHFRGFDRFYSVPCGYPDARGGEWRDGPGMELFSALRRKLGELDIIAENLGLIDDGVRRLLRDTGFPGMNVLQFAFCEQNSESLPHNLAVNNAVYTGTHDNPPLAAWLDAAPQQELERAERYLCARKSELHEAITDAALRSVCRLAIIPLQDWLRLGADARMNTPSVLYGNWSWRVRKSQLTARLAAEMRGAAARYGRLPEQQPRG